MKIFKNNVQFSDGTTHYFPETKSKGTWEYYDPDDQDFPKNTGNWEQLSECDGFIYKTPMDTYYYTPVRKPIAKRIQGKIPNFIKDSISHRESIMASQSVKFNKNKFNRL